MNRPHERVKAVYRDMLVVLLIPLMVLYLIVMYLMGI